MVKERLLFEQFQQKEPTQLHKDFAAWLQEVTGLEVDEKTVQLAVALRIPFQKSEANVSAREKRKTAKPVAAAKAPAKKAAPVARKGPSAVKKLMPKVTETPATDEEIEELVEEAAAAPSKPAARKGPVARKAPAKKAVPAATPAKKAPPARAAKTATAKAAPTRKRPATKPVAAAAEATEDEF